MADFPIVVGINRTQDGSLAVAVGESGMYSLQKERVSRREHHWGRLGDLPDRYLPAMPLLKEPVDLVVEGYSSDTEIEHAPAYQQEVRETLGLRDGAEIVLVSHHLSHLYGAFYPSPFEEAAGLVIDTRGSHVRDFTEEVPLPPGTGGDLVEVASFYRCARGRVECLAKQLWDGDWARPAGLGCFNALLARALWPEGEGDEGKVTALAPFGDPDALGLPDLDVRGHEVHLPPAWLEVFGRRDAFRYEPGGEEFRRAANLAAAGQRAFERALDRVAAWLHAETGLDALAFAGGAALNSSANGRLIRESPFREVFIPPAPHAAGTAVGCALYGLIACLGVDSRFRWTDDFLGPDPDESEIEAAVRALPAGLYAEQPPDLAGTLVTLLESGRVVGLHQGRSESGPRALGNRSILGDPRGPDMQDYLNFEVKGREWFHPTAPVVLAEHAAQIFELDRPAPFGHYAVAVRPEHRDGLPAITHVDGTATPQTVTRESAPFLHALLTRWHERTGTPVLVNASLSGPGEPPAETPEHAVDTLLGTGLHALAMPPYLIRKRVEPPLPGELA
ncbi:carbamoyltransferase C-terminal domain-containing protein [Nonomuraea rubra]|uniref:Carbamoyltransferase n=2 Tax=Nonomuraea rubra TaxID=46180 RepID=A0A7X0NL05_9ACTN|nr:carbamoyltransferase C-terminal domain-containing protein [Nonomuraea rubra]MBB6545321.1 carbamoyltransferase [Nonomuraea rubra]